VGALEVVERAAVIAHRAPELRALGEERRARRVVVGEAGRGGGDLGGRALMVPRLGERRDELLQELRVVRRLGARVLEERRGALRLAEVAAVERRRLAQPLEALGAVGPRARGERERLGELRVVATLAVRREDPIAEGRALRRGAEAERDRPLRTVGVPLLLAHRGELEGERLGLP